MKHCVFCVKDRLADVFGQPFQQANNQSAIRAFKDSVNSVGDTNMLNKHPDDFDLYVLGTFDDTSGMYATGVPEVICLGKEAFVAR